MQNATRTAFKNETIKNFDDTADAAAMKEALARVKQRFGEEYPLVIDGRRITSSKQIRSINPANSERDHRHASRRQTPSRRARRSRRRRARSNPGSI